jgi:hypothetical protein
MRLNLSIWNVCDLCLFPASLSLTFATIRRWSVSQSVTLYYQTSSTFCPFVVYYNYKIQYMIVSIPVAGSCLWNRTCQFGLWCVTNHVVNLLSSSYHAVVFALIWYGLPFPLHLVTCNDDIVCMEFEMLTVVKI